MLSQTIGNVMHLLTEDREVKATIKHDVRVAVMEVLEEWHRQVSELEAALDCAKSEVTHFKKLCGQETAECETDDATNVIAFPTAR